MPDRLRDRELDFPQSIVPGGRQNAVAIRYWREFIRRILTTVNEAQTALVSAGAANNVAQGAAANSQANAAAINTLNALAAQLRADLDAHTPLQAGPGVLGHVRQGAAVGGAGAGSAGAAPAAYTQAHSDALSARADDAEARLDTLIASLQGAGVIQ